MGSNPSTESNNTTEITARKRMQVLCMRRQGTKENSTHKGAKELKHSSKKHRRHTVAPGRECKHINICNAANTQFSTEHNQQARRIHIPATTIHPSHNLAEQDLEANSKATCNFETYEHEQQLRAFAPANNSLYKRYRAKEIFERSPTLPQLSKTTAGIDGNLSEKLTQYTKQRKALPPADTSSNIKTRRCHLLKRRRSIDVSKTSRSTLHKTNHLLKLLALTKRRRILLALQEEAVPLQLVEAVADASVEQPPVLKRKSQKRKRRLVLSADDETINAPTDHPDAAVETTVDEHPAAEVGSTGEKQLAVEVAPATDYPDAVIKKFDLPYDDLIAKWDAERPVVTASDTDEDVETMDVGAAGGDQQMSLEDIHMTIPVDVPLAYARIEITNITMGKEIQISGVDEKTQYLASLPKIPLDNKRKAILVEKDPIKGNPAKEHYYLICADIDLLVHLRAQVIDAVDQFFHSFSFKKLATINIEELSKKEEQVLCWGETETTHVALNRKRALAIVEPDSSFGYRQPTVFALHFSQFCTVFIDYSLFSWLPTADITDFLSSNAMDKTVFRSVQLAQNTVSVAPFVQMIDEPSSSESSSDDILMDFVGHDTTAATSHSPPTISADVQNVLAQLRASVDLIQFELLEHKDDVKKIRETLSLHINNLERTLSERFDAHDRTYRVLFNNVRHDMRDHKNLLSLDLKSYQLKVDILSSRLDDVKKDVEATKESISHQILEFQSQAQANHIVLTNQLGQLVDYINRGGTSKKGEGESSRGPQPPHTVQIRDSGYAGCSGDAVRTKEISQADVDAANRQILERMMREDREREREKRSKSRSGSYKRRRY
ncbi:autophagy-related protein 11-like [Dorcoceras hygrometricum]|uniref:Autophagy-related protein 11-like n=1 Tax=Dorcoceras hygrometricum TaxID=472368 RepID=A0A2Z7CE51_9LAMI|nr:autophagy-related protein 11-like [Dorcoceras hygrometricum]